MSSGRPPQSSSGGDVASKTRYDRDEHDFKNDREHGGGDCDHGGGDCDHSCDDNIPEEWRDLDVT